MIIADFPNYAVNENGEVFNLKTKRKLKPIKRKGYLYVGLYNDKKEKIMSVHRLVAKAFIKNPDNLPCVNHKDENKENNSVSNLEWCSYKYNNHYGKNKPINNIKKAIKKTSKIVFQYQVNGEFINAYKSAREASRLTGINQSNICKCCNGKYKKTGGFVWKYKELNELLGL